MLHQRLLKYFSARREPAASMQALCVCRQSSAHVVDAASNKSQVEVTALNQSAGRSAKARPICRQRVVQAVESVCRRHGRSLIASDGPRLGKKFRQNPRRLTLAKRASERASSIHWAIVKEMA